MNEAIIIGHISNDPEFSISDDGLKAVTFDVAEIKDWDNAADMQSDKTSWHRVVIRGDKAKIAENSLKKGSKVYLKGRLKNYDVEGFTASKILVSDFNLLSDISEDEQEIIKEHGFNKVDFIGLLTEAPNIRIFDETTGLKKGTLSLMVEETWTDKKGQRNRDTDFFIAMLNDGTSRSVEKSISRGAKLFITGEMKTFKHNDSKGKQHYKNNILPSKILILSDR